MNEFYKRENPHRLYRDKQNAWLAGVCAGIADYCGFNRKGVRVAFALTLLFPPFIPFAAVSYIVLAIVQAKATGGDAEVERLRSLGYVE